MEVASGWTGDISLSSGDWDFATNSPGGNSLGTGPSGPASGTTYTEFEASSGAQGKIGKMTSPVIDLTNVTLDAELGFYMHAFGSEMGELNVSITNVATGVIDTLFTQVGQYQTAATDPWVHIGNSLSAYLGQQITVSFSQEHFVSGWEGDMAIDLVTVQGCVACPTPTGLTGTPSASFATIHWTSPASNFEVEYGPAGYPPGFGFTATTTNDSIVITGLTPGSDYEFSVRALCAGTTTSTWMGPIALTTLCGVVNIPYSAALNAVPNCWDLTSGDQDWSISSFSGYAYTSYWRGSVGDEMIISTTDFDISGDAHIQFDWSHFSDTTSNSDSIKLQVKTLPSGSWTDVWVLGDSAFNSNDGAVYYSAGSFVHETVVLPTSLTGNDVSIRFLFVTNKDASCYIKNFYIEEIPSCNQATNIQSTRITDVDVALAWTSTAADFALEYGISGFPKGSGTVTSSTTNSISLTGLTPGTSYDYYVRAICGNNDSSLWTGPISFTTACTAITDFVEGFEAYPSTGMATCWTGSAFSTATGAYVYVYQYSSPNTGSRHVKFYNSNDDSARLMLVSPNLSNISAGTHRLGFYVNDNTNDLVIGTMSDPTNESTFTPYDTITATSGYTHYWVEFTSYSGSDSYVAFKTTRSANYKSTYMDDIVWEKIPTCYPPIDLMGSFTSDTSATLTWNEPRGSAQWEVEYDTTGFALATGFDTLVSAITFNADSLPLGMGYDFYVRSVCGVNDTSKWAGPYNLNFGCATITDFVESFDAVSTPDLPTCWSSAVIAGNTSARAYSYSSTWNAPNSAPNHIRMYNSNDVGAKVILVTPGLSTVTTGTHRVRFYSYSSDNVQVVVGTMGNPNDANTFTPRDTITVTPTYSEYTAYFSNYTGTDMFVGFRALYAGTYDYLYLDDIVWEVNVTCPAPNTPTYTATNISANIGWVENGSATAWEVEYGLIGFAPGTGTSAVTLSNPLAISALTPNTFYEYYVTAICGVGDSSIVAGPYSFVTECNVRTAPYMEDVDSYAVTSQGIVSGCWEQTGVLGYNYNWNISTGYTWGSGPEDAYSGSNYFRIRSSGLTGDTAMLLSHSIDVSTVSNPTLKFYYHMFGTDMGDLYISVLDGGNWTVLDSLLGQQQTAQTDDWRRKEISLPVTVTGVTQIKFTAIRDGYSGSMGLDDIEIVGSYAKDLSVIAVDKVGDVCGLGMDSIKIQILNEGTASQTAFNVGYTFDGVAIAAETVSDTVAPGDTLEYTFTTLANFVNAGTTPIMAYSLLAGDGASFNDTIASGLNKTYVISSFPYEETFVTGKNGWIVDNSVNGSWDLGNPMKSVIKGAASDTNCFVTSLFGYSNQSEESAVYSPCFDFTSLNTPVLSLKTWWELSGGANVEYSLDKGITWTSLGAQGEGDNWYNRYSWTLQSDIWYGYGQGSTWTPSGSKGWVSSTISIDHLAGEPQVNFRVNYVSNSWGDYDGFAFDDFKVFEAADLGNDTLLCSVGSLTLSPGVYDTYLWSDDSELPILFLDGAIQPEGVDTITVIAASDGGYKMFDTVVVTVEKPVIILGADTLLCFQDEITLDAGTGFASYMWNDASTSQTLTTDGSVTGASTYYVTGLTPNACQASDSIVVNVNTEVLVDLGIDTTFFDSTSQATSYELDAGPGFSSYLWSTGDVTQKVTIDSSNDGLIDVTVENVVGCIGTDSVMVSFVLGIDNLTVSEIRMYPNPATDRLNVEVSNFNNLEEVQISIMDITGRVMMTKTLSGSGQSFNETYDVSNYATGTYFVRFEANGEVVTRQFIIK
jgi:hypothetical protein